jgi:MoxR-like ATPase
MASDWVKKALIGMRAGRAVYVQGAPGIGKSWQVADLHRQLWGAEAESKPLVTVMAALSDPTSFCGIEHVIEGETVRTVPSWAKRLIKAGGGTLFLDEATLATPATWTALLRVVLDRVAGDADLPESVRIILCGNPVSMTNAGCELPPAAANRLLHLTAEAPTIAGWADFIESWSADRGEHMRRAASIVGAYLVGLAKPEVLLNVPADESKRAEAWPSPRSWHAAVECVAAAFEAGDIETGLALVEAAVGASAASGLSTFLREADLPKPRDVLTGKVQVKFERHRPDRAAAILRGCSAEAVNGPAVDKQERAYLVEQAWGVAKGACDGLLSDIVLKHTAQLSQWRVMKSGAPLAKGANEAAVIKETGEVAKRSI